MAERDAKVGRRVEFGELNQLAGYQLRRASNLFMTDLVETLSDAGIRPAQFAILLLIAENPGFSQSEISRILAIKKTNMVPLVTELERRGLLVRAPDPNDGRAQLLSLTPEAGPKLSAWRKRVATQEAARMKNLTAEESRRLLALLSKLRGSQ